MLERAIEKVEKKATILFKLDEILFEYFNSSVLYKMISLCDRIFVAVIDNFC